jgi:hypothetical protein
MEKDKETNKKKERLRITLKCSFIKNRVDSIALVSAVVHSKGRQKLSIGCQMIANWLPTGCQLVANWLPTGCQLVDS